MERIVGILIALLALGIMMTIHELGHYLTGRKLGFKIEEFMIFMGPVLWSWEKNGIKYSLRLFPIGAAVQFAGEMAGSDDNGEDTIQVSEDSPVYDKNDPGLFMNRPKRYRAVVLAAGSLANILSGVLIFALMFAFTGYITPDISRVPEGTQAHAAGLEVGDRIILSNEQKIKTNLDLSFSFNFLEADEAVDIQVEKLDGRVVDLTLLPEARRVYQVGITTDGSKDEIHVLGVADWQNNNNPVFEIGDIILEVNGAAVDQNSLSSVVTELGGNEAEFLI